MALQSLVYCRCAFSVHKTKTPPKSTQKTPCDEAGRAVEDVVGNIPDAGACLDLGPVATAPHSPQTPSDSCEGGMKSFAVLRKSWRWMNFTSLLCSGFHRSP